MSVTLQPMDSVPPGHGIWNVFRLLSDNDREETHLNTTYISWWDIPLPYGLVFDLGKERTVAQVDLRNGYALKDGGHPDQHRCSLNYLGVFETLIASPWN